MMRIVLLIITPAIVLPGCDRFLKSSSSEVKVTNVSSTSANSMYKVGSTISIQVTFSDTVKVTGTPQLELETGSTDRSATYSSGSETAVLTFTYVTMGGDAASDLDYVSPSSLSVDDGRIVDSDDQTVTLPTPGDSGSLSANNALSVDAIRPTVQNVTASTGNGAYKLDLPVSIQVVFSEAVTVVGVPTLTVETGSTDRVVSYSSGSGTTELTFLYYVQAGDTASDLDYVGTTSLSAGMSIRDAVGNDAMLALASPGASGSLSANKSILVDARTKIAAGFYTSCRRSPTGTVKCWGENHFGQLGQGHTNAIGDGANEMGDNLAAIDFGSRLGLDLVRRVFSEAHFTDSLVHGGGPRS